MLLERTFYMLSDQPYNRSIILLQGASERMLFAVRYKMYFIGFIGSLFRRFKTYILNKCKYFNKGVCLSFLWN